MNIIQIFQIFPDQQACISYLESIRWKSGIRCAYCNSSKIYVLKDPNRSRYNCNFCHKSFSVTTNTIFHDTRLPLQKWFVAISLILNARKGISALQLARDISVNRKTARSMSMRIRKALSEENGEKRLLSGVIEMDETFVGGAPRKGVETLDRKRGRGTKKTPVVGMIERKGKVKTAIVDQLKSKPLNDLIRRSVDIQNSILITDEYAGYARMKTIIDHHVVNHKIWYTNGEIHTNTIESYWAILKRGIIGQFHKVTKKWLPLYLNEFSYRFNNRRMGLDSVFQDVVGRMTKQVLFRSRI